ncbi:MAG: hypothetical protein ACREOG_06280 [Gemmatimonadaceae bacterium]
MTRILIARALGVLLGALALTLLANGIQGFGYADSAAAYALLATQIVAGPLTAVSGYWLWRRERRSLIAAGVGLGLATTAGTLAAWTYTPDPDRSSAAFGALGAGVVFSIALIVLARLALPQASLPPSPGQIS